MNSQLSLSTIQSLVDGSVANPGSLLGRHPVNYRGREATSVRVLEPNAESVWLIDSASGLRRPMRRLHPGGFFEAICDEPITKPSMSRLQMIDKTGKEMKTTSPYTVPSIFSDLDRYLIGEGRHHQLYERLGAQLREVDGVKGVNFAVWAPNARSVQVVGDFNGWDGRSHVAQPVESTGIWELFLPGATVGQKYKFRIQTQHGHWMDKCDPLAFAAELPPLTANIITDINTYSWNDSDWLQQRAEMDPMHTPMNVYEVHLGSWQKGPGRTHGWLDYRDLAKRLVDYCHRMNFTHVELMPISEHPFTGSWGYQSVGYYAPTSRHGSPEDFMFFVDHMHQNGIGVLIDWVPAHFPKDDHGLRQFDGSALYEHADPRQGEHPDWGTMIFNFGRNEVKNFLIANALFWLDKYHIDGLRVDAVASMLYLDYSREDGEWIPNRYGGRENLESIDFLRDFNIAVHENHPGVITAAEESTAWPGVSRPTYDGGLGFTYKWNMGWMNDTLSYMRNEPIHRKFHQNELTFSLIYAFTENFTLPLSHDEVVHGKGSLISQMPGDMWQKFANLRLLYSYMWTHPGKKLLFMGGEIAQWTEWNADDGPQWELLDFDTHRGVQQLVADLNEVVIENPALHWHDFTGDGFEWIDAQNAEDSVLVYLRKGAEGDPPILVCNNFTPVPRDNYRVGVPAQGFWKEIFNSDGEAYGGSNLGNYPGCQTTGIEHHARPDSIEVTLPPLGTTILRLES
ncbi:1,4-alpha-glucan branching protein GlgB [Rhodopirellula europaea]|uniref:1,4-alpha-glucan branching enzyme GlgB n=1 Tax=Rhodopirellula europaea 6C TaxID=1263867 RepID=M2B510_9BACT|nr:1,4-alpha-glucan branching protein GlgB [Rhodopirellula europaea]EMB17304.1 protein containing 1,4-alpha-glucan branching enzyme, core region [Rhodopirellula europaea 6C]